MKELMFFDCDCQIGNTLFGPKPGVEELLAEMDRSGIDQALVRNGNFGPVGAVKANEETAQMLRKDLSGRLYGVWGILPVQCDEQPAGDVFFSAMKQNRIKALTLDPAAHRFEACRITIGKLLDEAAERKIPVLLYPMQNNWKNVYDFMERFPDQLCIAGGGHKWGNDRYIRPLLENYPNLYISTAGYWVPEGLGDLVKIYGADRLLYGSGFPDYDQGSGMLQLKYAGLNDSEIAQIAGGNLKSLLEGVLL